VAHLGRHEPAARPPQELLAELFFEPTEGPTRCPPLGSALIGYRAGDALESPTPRGTRRLVIEEVLFQPEAAGRR
jgi:hypothetical protein